MHYIRFTLVLGILALTAIPVYAAQVCEAEIRAIEETVNAGGNPGIQGFRERGANIRQSAIESIKDSTKDPSLCDDTYYSKLVAKTEDSIRRIETRIKNGGEQRADGSRPSPGAVGSVEYDKMLLLDVRAKLAVLKFRMCVYAKTCYTPKKGAISTPIPMAKSDTANRNSLSTDRTSAPAPKPAPAKAASSSSKQPKEKKYHYPEYVATECLSLIKEKTLYGGFINSCPFKVAYGWCVEEPKKGGWSESAACGNETRGAGQVVGAKSRDGQHTKGGKKVHWVACMYEDRNGNFLDVGPRDVSWNGQKKQMKFRCGDLMPRK